MATPPWRCRGRPGTTANRSGPGGTTAPTLAKSHPSGTCWRNSARTVWSLSFTPPNPPPPPGRLKKNGKPCPYCLQRLASCGQRCGNHASPEELAQREAANQFLEARRLAYHKDRARLDRKRRPTVVNRESSCAACGGKYSGPRSLHMDHIVDVSWVVAAGFPVEAADVLSNLWVLCRECHRAKTNAPPREPNAWGWDDKPNASHRAAMAAWAERLADYRRRRHLIDQALRQRKDPPMPGIPWPPGSKPNP